LILKRIFLKIVVKICIYNIEMAEKSLSDDSTFCGLKKWFHHLIEKLGWLLTNEELSENKKEHYKEQIDMWLEKINFIKRINITDLEKHDIKVMERRLILAKVCIGYRSNNVSNGKVSEVSKVSGVSKVSNGETSNGITSNGETSNGIASNGIASNGETSNGKVSGVSKISKVSKVSETSNGEVSKIFSEPSNIFGGKPKRKNSKKKSSRRSRKGSRKSSRKY